MITLTPSGRAMADLQEAPEWVGAEVRAPLSHLSPRKLSTMKAPVIFANMKWRQGYWSSGRGRLPAARYTVNPLFSARLAGAETNSAGMKLAPSKNTRIC